MEIKERIWSLKKEKNAIILAHNYQRASVQDVADFTGDSFGLSKKAVNTKADIIVFPNAVGNTTSVFLWIALSAMVR